MKRKSFNPKFKTNVANPYSEVAMTSWKERLLSASNGIVLYPKHGESPDELVNYPDQAMYPSEGQGKNQYY